MVVSTFGAINSIFFFLSIFGLKNLVPRGFDFGKKNSLFWDFLLWKMKGNSASEAHGLAYVFVFVTLNWCIKRASLVVK